MDTPPSPRPDAEELDAILAYRPIARALLRGEVPAPDDVEAFLVSCGRHEAAYVALAERLESVLAENAEALADYLRAGAWAGVVYGADDGRGFTGYTTRLCTRYTPTAEGFTGAVRVAGRKRNATVAL